MHRHTYPFAAVVGQENVKKALLLNLVEPRIGGVLLCGQKGTAKSTIVRGMAELSDQKVVDLPLSITEDMLVGSIDFEKAVKDGVREFSGGLLARADGNVLYVDEVNLLSDGIINTLICAAAAGENIVEREGISYRHACRFSLVGTMNPEEGKLRPQFLDRFGLYVQVGGETDIASRTEIIKRRLENERDPAAFCSKWAAESAALKAKILRAKEAVKLIEPDDTIRLLISKYAVSAGAEGNRCEVVLARASAAAAALAGRDYISAEDVKEAAPFVLAHRRREQMPEDIEPPQPEEDDPKDEDQERPEDQEQEQDQTPPDDDQEMEQNDQELTDDVVDTPPPQNLPEGQDNDQEDLVEGDETGLISIIPRLPRDRQQRKGSGRRSRTKSGANKGRYASYTQRRTETERDLALDATLRAAAP